MVTDYTDTTRSHWSSKILAKNSRKKNSLLQTCATSHEKGSTEGGTKGLESRARMKNHLLVLESNQETTFALLDLTWYRYTHIVCPFLNWNACTCLSHHYRLESVRDGELVFVSFTVRPMEKNSTWVVCRDYTQGNSFIFSTLGVIECDLRELKEWIYFCMWKGYEPNGF